MFYCVRSLCALIHGPLACDIQTHMGALNMFHIHMHTLHFILRHVNIHSPKKYKYPNPPLRKGTLPKSGASDGTAVYARHLML